MITSEPVSMLPHGTSTTDMIKLQSTIVAALAPLLHGDIIHTGKDAYNQLYFTLQASIDSEVFNLPKDLHTEKLQRRLTYAKTFSFFSESSTCVSSPTSFLYNTSDKQPHVISQSLENFLSTIIIFMYNNYNNLLMIA